MELAQITRICIFVIVLLYEEKYKALFSTTLPLSSTLAITQIKTETWNFNRKYIVFIKNLMES